MTTYQEENKANLKREREKEAIVMAMEGRWKEAVAANKDILGLFPSDVDAYNRLGRALMELGEYAEAKQAYSKALEIDPYNSIARKNLNRLSYLAEEQVAPKGDQHKLPLNLFVEEAGKAGVVNLVNLAPKKVLARMAAGDLLSLKTREHSLIVENIRGEYIGGVEPEHGLRLAKLIEGGNRYAAAIASLGGNEAKVVIREVYQHPSQAGRLSFPPKALEGFRGYTRESILKYELGEEGEEATEEEGVLPEEAEPYEGMMSPAEEEEQELTEEE